MVFNAYALMITFPEAKTVFTVIPVSIFQRRHFRIDTDVLYRLLSEVNALPKKIGLRKSWINIIRNQFFHNRLILAAGIGFSTTTKSRKWEMEKSSSIANSFRFEWGEGHLLEGPTRGASSGRCRRRSEHCVSMMKS